MSNVRPVNINTHAVYLEKEVNFSDPFNYLQNEKGYDFHGYC